MWNERLQKIVLEKDGMRMATVSGDRIFPKDCMIGAHHSQNGIALTEDESVFNAYMAKQRMAMEWGFGKVMQLFQFTNLKLMKYGLSPIAPYYFVSVLLTNCHTCYFNSKAAVSLIVHHLMYDSILD